jgi:PAS domain S-box-containing protein
MVEKIEHLYLTLRSIREVHRLLLRMKNRSQLLQAICDALVENRSYYNAWVVLLDDSNLVLETAESGLGDAFGPMLERLRRRELTECARRALDRHSVVVVNDPYDACDDCPLSGNYSGRSAMTVRLEHEGVVYGLLCVSMPRPFTENDEELELLQEIAGDIAYGLSRFALEKSLEKNRRRFRDLVENAPTGILIAQDGIIVYRNPEQARISGPHHDVNSKLEFDNVDPDDVEKVQEFYERIASGARPTIDTDFRFYVSGRTHDRADMKWVYCRANAIEYKGKKAVLINMIDMTRSKELEQLVLVKDKMASLGHIAAGIAHEIRNPLSGINIYLNTLENYLDGAEHPEMTSKILSQIQSASRKIESIIKRVVDFSKPSEPRLDLTDVRKPIEEAVELSSVTMRKQGVKIQMTLSDDLPQCYIDPTLIEEVLLNLMTNAAEAMRNQEGDKFIEVASTMEDGFVLITVSDSGPGIPAQLRTKVFEPFYTTKKTGSGIGLSLCHRIISDHGGSMSVKTSRWSGAEFAITLPVEDKP